METILDETPHEEAEKPRDPIREEYDDLQAQLQRNIEERAFWKSTLSNPIMKSYLQGLIDELNEPVVVVVDTIAVKDFADWRAQLLAKKFLVEEFGKKDESGEVEAMRHAITAFENSNSLFLSEPQVEDTTDEGPSEDGEGNTDNVLPITGQTSKRKRK